MIYISEIQKIIEDITLIMNYYLPGHVFFMVYGYCCGIRIEHSVNRVIGSVVMSVISTSALSLTCSSLHGALFLAVDIGALFLLGIILAMIAKSHLYSMLFSKVFHQTSNKDFWADVIDPNGMVADISHGDKRYAGFVHLVEKEGDNRWLTLSNYKIIDSNNQIIEEGRATCEILIKVSDEDVVRLVYSPDSAYRHK